MFKKLIIEIWVFIYFYLFIESYCFLLIKSKDKSNNSENWQKQWNSSQWPGSLWPAPGQWPASQWNTSQWPSNQWNTSQMTPVIWNSSQWPPNQFQSTHRPSTQWLPPQRPSSSVWWPPTNRPQMSTSGWATQPTFSPPNQSSNQTITTNQNESFSITVKSCGMSHIPHSFIGDKIVSGKVAQSGEFPWQVILKIHTARGPMQCGGAILNSRWVLTAAHCVSNERNGQPTAQRIDVSAGVHNRLVVSAGTQQKTADCVVQHESWNGQYGKFKHDIALIRLPADNPFDINYDRGGHINGICLPTKPLSEFMGRGRIAGWGLTKDRGSPSDVLMYTDVSILENNKCKTFPYPVPIADSMMCQGVDRTAPCQGDSGGPLIISTNDNSPRMIEIGIVSFGPGECANPKTPNAIYTKTSYYLNWIEKTIRANSGQRCGSRTLRRPQESNDKNNDKNKDIEQKPE